MRVLVSGYYGFNNLGDEALLEVIVTQLRSRFPSLTVDVLSNTPDATAQKFDIVATPRWNSRAVREAIARADVVLSGGGGLLQNATSVRSVLYYAGILRDAVRRKRKTMIFAQSIGPLDTIGRAIVRALCKGVDRATVRDARSRDLLHGLLKHTPTELTADPVFLYDLPVPQRDLRIDGLGDAPYAIVSVRKIPALKDGIAAIACAVDRLADQHGIRSAFLPLGGAADAEVSTTIIRACKSAPMLLPECELERAASIIAGAHAVVGMRLHALILAARFGVPFLAVPYDPKVSSLCADLAYPLEPLWVPGSKVPTNVAILARVDELVARRDDLHAHLLDASERMRASAARNFEVLGELLDES